VIFAQIKIVRIHSTANPSPGKIPAMKRAPIDCSVIRPYIIRKMVGGMRQPRVPTIATSPVPSVLEYP
jgi:hypothetical protein